MKQSSKLSVIIPAYNAENDLPGLIEALERQELKPLEVIVIDDCSTDNTKAMAEKHFTVLSTPKNSGPAAARNVGISHAKGEYLGFLDSDCRPEPDWTRKIEEAFEDQKKDVLAGGLYVEADTVLGKSIAALGYPGGGSIGFDKMWRVSDEGTVTKICTANLALRKNVIEEHGAFDESFDYCFEDAYFSDCLTRDGVPIHYAPEMKVEHAARETLQSFVKWHYSRGRGIDLYRSKIGGKMEGLLRLRLWSTANIIKKHRFDLKLPLILSLLGLSAVVQKWASLKEKRKQK